MAQLVTESPAAGKLLSAGQMANAIWRKTLRAIQWTDGRVRNSV
jgi:hypothetical protein